jgi:DNA (cytosine-5)-methyltransferase 1
VSRPRLLDMFCGAGGCAMGYHRAGFNVVGVDHRPQPRYPFAFVQGDALEYVRQHGHEFDVIHASPPCQRFSAVTRTRATQDRHPDLVEPTRRLLQSSDRPWVIENVIGAPLLCPILLCGTFFGLRVIRHRLFESSLLLMAPSNACAHPPRGTVGRAGVRGKSVGDWISVAGDTDLRVASHAMNIDWMRNRHEIAQSIPPAYTEFLGRQLMTYLESMQCPAKDTARGVKGEAQPN